MCKGELNGIKESIVDIICYDAWNEYYCWRDAVEYDRISER